jgi:hypothetical protein
MEETMVEAKTGRKVRMAKMSIEVRLLNIACLCFITAQYVVRAHPSDHGFWMLGQGFRIAALLTFIAAQVIGLRTRKA